MLDAVKAELVRGTAVRRGIEADIIISGDVHSSR